MRKILIVVAMCVVLLGSLSLAVYCYSTGEFLRPPGLDVYLSGWNTEGQKYINCGTGNRPRKFYEDWFMKKGFVNQLGHGGDFISDRDLVVFGYRIRRSVWVAGGDKNFTVGYQMNIGRL